MSEGRTSSGPVSSRDPDEIREEIEVTRVNLSTDVNALADSVKPGNVARRQAGKVRGAASGLKERVMGSDTASSTGSTVSSAKSSVQDAASSVSDAASAAPSQVRERTQGNPLAAGLIAFGVGWLASSLLPASQVEQQAAQKVKEGAEPLKEKATEAAKEVADNLKEPAREAAESVKQTATDAAGTVQGEGRSAAGDVKDQAQDARDTVQESRR